MGDESLAGTSSQESLTRDQTNTEKKDESQKQGNSSERARVLISNLLSDVDDSSLFEDSDDDIDVDGEADDELLVSTPPPPTLVASERTVRLVAGREALLVLHAQNLFHATDDAPDDSIEEIEVRLFCPLILPLGTVRAKVVKRKRARFGERNTGQVVLQLPRVVACSELPDSAVGVAALDQLPVAEKEEGVPLHAVAMHSTRGVGDPVVVARLIGASEHLVLLDESQQDAASSFEALAWAAPQPSPCVAHSGSSSSAKSAKLEAFSSPKDFTAQAEAFLAYTHQLKPCSSSDVFRGKVALEMLRANGDMTARYLVAHSTPLILRATKINNVGRRQRRVLRITRHGIENQRPSSGKVSVRRPWRDIYSVHMAGARRVVISLRDDAHRLLEEEVKEVGHSMRYSSIVHPEGENVGAEGDLVYVTSRAADVCAAIERRVSLFEATQRMAKEARLAERYGDMAPSFVPEEVQQAQRRCDSRVETVGRSSKVSQLLGTDTAQRAEEALREALMRRLLSSETDEGRARHRFVHKEFGRQEKKGVAAITAMRTFMDALKQHTLQEHGTQLSLLLRHSGGDANCQNNNKENNKEENNNKENNNSDSRNNNIENNNSEVVARIVENCVERVVVLPLRRRVLQTVQRDRSLREAETKMRRNVRALADKAQQFFGVPEHQVSATNWDCAVETLRRLRRTWPPLPSLSCAQLVHCAKAIYATHEFETVALRGGTAQDALLNGDDLLPICIYVVVQAAQDAPEEAPPLSPVLLTVLETLLDPASAVGELGYYLTVFRAAVEWLVQYLPDEQ